MSRVVHWSLGQITPKDLQAWNIGIHITTQPTKEEMNNELEAEVEVDTEEANNKGISIQKLLK